MKALLAFALIAVGCTAPPPANAPSAADACSGISEAARTTPLLSDPGAIVAVRTLVHPIKSENQKVAFTRVIGAEVVMRVDAGATAEHLERVARCQISLHPTDGPLGVPSAEARVISLDEGFALQITSSNPSDAKEIVARAERARAR